MNEEDAVLISSDDDKTIEVNSSSSSSSSSSKTTINSNVSSTSSNSNRQLLPTNWLGEKSYILFTSILIGLFTGLNIALFKSAIEFVREVLYGDGIELQVLSPYLFTNGGKEILTYTLTFSEILPLSAIPAVGGLIVGILLRLGDGDMPPGLRDAVKEVDLDSLRASNVSPLPPELVTCTKNIPPPNERNDFVRFTRKALAATATLGTGNSLGPEGPSVEAGMSISRLLMNNAMLSQLLTWLFGTLDDSNNMSNVQRVNRKLSRDRLLLACGAAAGVSAGFNAPLSGVFFALEIVQNSLSSIDIPISSSSSSSSSSNLTAKNGDIINGLNNDNEILQMSTIGGEALALQQINISAILLASVVSALTIQLLLGKELALQLGAFDFNNPLLELPLYLILGVMSGVTAATFSGVAQLLKSLFDGKVGPEFIQVIFQSIPKYAKPLIGSVICGLVAVYIPQVLFFGYETLNGLFLNNNIPTGYLFLLLVAKLLTTAISASSGLVGGTFAPSLFLGGVLGAGFHNIISDSLYSISIAYPQLSDYPIFQGVSGLPAFAMVGAASVLAALFRAPLTASLLLFECTGNYDVILPLMASAGVASLTGDIVEKWFDEEQRESDNVSWGALATRNYNENEDDDEACVVPIERE
jgi:H+/Cl- antiporter ClcA